MDPGNFNIGIPTDPPPPPPDDERQSAYAASVGEQT